MDASAQTPVLLPALWQAVGHVIRVVAAFGAWWLARKLAAEPLGWAKLADESGRKGLAGILTYAQVILACAMVAGILWASYGTHVEDADPLFGGGDRVTDSLPTAAQRDRHGWSVFFTLLPIALHGTWYGQRDGKA